MDLHHRKLLSDSIKDICELSCDPSNYSGVCMSQCISFCPDTCFYPIPSVSTGSPTPSPPISFPYHHQNKHKKFLIIGLVLLATIFFLVCCYAIYNKFFSSSRRRSEPQPQPQTDEAYDEFLDEDHGPVVDHHIWYINTIGLQPSIINAIPVCKYRKGDGLVEGTDCSVCLSEFEEDETLRLLPKCSHAFHVPCIDTWLRSHTNCPLCRAAIVKNTTRASSSSEANVDNLGVSEETQLNIPEDNEETDREINSVVHELRIEAQEECELAVENERKRSEDSNEEEDSIQPMRRSVSLDSLSAFKISQAVANVIPVESNGNFHTQLMKFNESNSIVPKRVGNQSLLRLMTSSSIGRSLQNGPTSLKRSFSCNGKFLLSKCSRSRDQNLHM